jgi:hypothetical protein
VTRDDLHTIYLAFVINGQCHHDRSFDMELVNGASAGGLSLGVTIVSHSLIHSSLELIPAD